MAAGWCRGHDKPVLLRKATPRVIGQVVLSGWILIALFSITAIGVLRLFEPPEPLSAWRFVYDLAMLTIIFTASFLGILVRYRELDMRVQFAKIIASIIGGLGIFSAAFKDIGMTVAGGVSHNPWDALFLSLASWTTFSATELAPIGQGIYIAIIEAWFGYFFLALLVAALIIQLQRVSDSRDRNGA